jgi:hypothetical protein
VNLPVLVVLVSADAAGCAPPELALKSRPGPPMTLGNAAATRVRLIVRCKACGRRVEPDDAEMARKYGSGTFALDWARAAHRTVGRCCPLCFDALSVTRLDRLRLTQVTVIFNASRA